MHAVEIAKLCHEVNRAYCSALGDTSHLPWDDAPGWQRDSAIKGVRSLLAGQITSPEATHEAWLAYKQQEGWTFGPVKDAALKQHPCCVPYAQLPAAEKAKDYIFKAIVDTVRSIDGDRLGDGKAGFAN